MQDFLTVVEAEANALKPFAADLVGPQIARLVEAVGEHAGRRAARHRAHQRIIGVQDRDAARISRGQRLHQLGFGLRDPLDGTQALQVRRADIGDDADARLGQTAQARDLAEIVHAHLEHDALDLRRQLQQRQRQADLVVQIAFVALRGVALFQHIRHDLLGGRLADAAGDTNRHGGHPLAPGGRQLLETAQAIRHDEDIWCGCGLSRRGAHSAIRHDKSRVQPQTPAPEAQRVQRRRRGQTHRPSTDVHPSSRRATRRRARPAVRRVNRPRPY